MAYWQNGKLYIHGSTQSTVQTVGVGRALASASSPTDVVLISEYTGGGFGSKIPGAISMAIPALLSKKANAPVMMRITREEEHYIGRARPGLHVARQGRLPQGRPHPGDRRLRHRRTTVRTTSRAMSARRASTISLCYQPTAMRWRTHHRAHQHAAEDLAARAGRHAGQRPDGAGHHQGRATSSGSIRSKSARSTRRPARRRSVPPAARGQQAYVTSAFVKEALDKGAELFNWEEKKARSGKRVGTKVRGSGVAVSAYTGRLDRLRRSARHQAGRQACSSSRASATSARTR